MRLISLLAAPLALALLSAPVAGIAQDEDAATHDDAKKGDDKPVSDLRKAIANDPNMTVMIAHGYNDLSCPYFGSKLIVEQMPRYGSDDRVQLHVYPGGHMFYARPASDAAFKQDAKVLIERG